ncbi:DNA-binding response regulator [Elizabethkingia anophelis]|uniref:LytR/AlgR family response regulator transcription factor n=1 Tax=Elizabethkingia anophelis TaxID=1117645 RepID=UPI0021A60E01|nr:response regulator transcription factor [Elizabethkingia anophelis]MCT3947651.1 response regulator transcription factor [Elizabethkingia anophelis]MDV3573466.1 DNA-binding response regulator [Elizabethkingia anophelis]MDV3601324.1 DNA-binding response regulator [Elizabethkingia anophelis]MDV3608611.1 DNA-binding response regulator [Elizabethkingia anophelis]
MKILIIEDEVLTARELERMLMKIDDSITVVKILDSVSESISFLKHNKDIDLIFSDIQLVDGNSFELHDQGLVNCPIVFCTAFNEYLLKAFKTNALSYILKPLNIIEIENALMKYGSFKDAFQSRLQATSLQKVSSDLGLSFKSTLLLEQRGKIIPMPIKEIACFYLENSWTQVITKANQKYTVTSSLEVLEKQLNPDFFYRANRQFLIGRSSILSIERFFLRKLAVKLIVETPERVVISKAKASSFLRWLEG